MRKLILSPLFAPAFILTYVGFFVFYIFASNANTDAYAMKAFTSGSMEFITYFGYTLTAVIVLALISDFDTPKLHLPYAMFLFLLAMAVLREMGAQHWIASQDTTAFKLRFFTNPNNPIEEKLFSASILIFVIGIVVYLLIKYTKPLISGFFKFNPVCWSVASLGGIAIISKTIDRFPGNYRKYTGESLEPLIQAWSVLLEETSEATIPLMFAIAVIQWHLLQKNKKIIDTDNK